jgi:hypothetical protein
MVSSRQSSLTRTFLRFAFVVSVLSMSSCGNASRSDVASPSVDAAVGSIAQQPTEPPSAEQTPTSAPMLQPTSVKEIPADGQLNGIPPTTFAVAPPGGTFVVDSPPSTSIEVQVPFIDSCVPGRWELNAQMFTRYVGQPSEGSAKLTVQSDGTYTVKGAFTLRLNVGGVTGDSVFAQDISLDQRGRFLNVTDAAISRKLLRVAPDNDQGVQTTGQRSEGSGAAPDGVIALEPIFDGFMKSATISCNDSSLGITMASASVTSTAGPVSVVFDRLP